MWRYGPGWKAVHVDGLTSRPGSASMQASLGKPCHELLKYSDSSERWWWGETVPWESPQLEIQRGGSPLGGSQIHWASDVWQRSFYISPGQTGAWNITISWAMRKSNNKAQVSVQRNLLWAEMFLQKTQDFNPNAKDFNMVLCSENSALAPNGPNK